jgi:hypothetical protein
MPQTPSRVLYFVVCDAVALVRIGAAVHLPSRLKELRADSPLPLRLLATMPGGPNDEGELHRRFRRLREHGEWFRAEERLLTFIATLHPPARRFVVRSRGRSLAAGGRSPPAARSLA